MALTVADLALVSPWGLTASEHVFFHRAEVTPHASGAFTNVDGEPLAIHDCAWIPALRPWSSRIFLLAKQALARVRPSSKQTPLVLLAPSAALEGAVDLARYLRFSGHTVLASHVGAASLATALASMRGLLDQHGEVVLLAVDSLLQKERIEAWFEARYSTFTRNPLPPSEGAAAMRFVKGTSDPVGRVLGSASVRSDAHDDNDVPNDGAALTQVLAELPLPAEVPLLVGPHDVDPLRARDAQIAVARHAKRFATAELPSLEGKLGGLGSAAGLMSAVFAMAWLAHGCSQGANVGVAWARSEDGTVAGVALSGGGS